MRLAVALLLIAVGCEEPPNLVVEVHHPHGLIPDNQVRVGDEVVGVIESVDRNRFPIRIAVRIERIDTLDLRADACATPTNLAVVLTAGTEHAPFEGEVVPACNPGRSMEESMRRLHDTLQEAQESGVDVSGPLEKLEQSGFGRPER